MFIQHHTVYLSAIKFTCCLIHWMNKQTVYSPSPFMRIYLMWWILGDFTVDHIQLTKTARAEKWINLYNFRVKKQSDDQTGFKQISTLAKLEMCSLSVWPPNIVTDNMAKLLVGLQPVGLSEQSSFLYRENSVLVFQVSAFSCLSKPIQTLAKPMKISFNKPEL